MIHIDILYIQKKNNLNNLMNYILFRTTYSVLYVNQL